LASRLISATATIALLLVLSACGGSPAAPYGVSAIQALLDRATPEIKINGAVVAPGSTTSVTVGTAVNYQVNFTNNSGQILHTALVIVRDDGAERLLQCGASGSGGTGGGFGVGHTIFSGDSVYTPGHTVRVLWLGAFNSSMSGAGQCYLQLSQGVVDHANVQAERLLATLAVQ
jgi:hypothetical protein